MKIALKNFLKWIALGAAGLFFIQAQASYAGGFVDQWIEWRNSQNEGAPAMRLDLFASLGAQDSQTTAGTVDQLIDPSNPSSSATFKQRYYIDPEFADGPGSPVFYVICGESSCTEANLRGAVATYAKRYHGYVVALEHRYYGQSQPFPTLSADNLKYLRTEFALADLARFEQYARTELGLSGKWVTVGGSYSGSLSAYYRLKYPELTVGALASSAPVQARENFEQYDYGVHEQLGTDCANAIRAAITQIEASLNDPDQLAAIQAKFDATEIQDPVDFLYVVADMAATAVQYGSKDQFCKGVLGQADPVTGYAYAGVPLFNNFGLTPYQDSFQAAMSENPADYASGVGSRQWLYQSCTEFGYFQNAYHDPAFSARSQLINPAFHQRICQKLFGTPPLDTTKITTGFYQPLLDPSTTRILVTNGSTDPWSMLSITEKLGNNTNPGIATYSIDGGSHCNDLATPHAHDSTSLQGARTAFTSLLDQWLGE